MAPLYLTLPVRTAHVTTNPDLGYACHSVVKRFHATDSLNFAVDPSTGILRSVADVWTPFWSIRSYPSRRIDAGGKQVVNLAIDGAPNKGTALVAERDRLSYDWALYVGDDENDEDTFALDGNTVPFESEKSRAHAPGTTCARRVRLTSFSQDSFDSKRQSRSRGVPYSRSAQGFTDLGLVSSVAHGSGITI